jgi:hypothetical protein
MNSRTEILRPLTSLTGSLSNASILTVLVCLVCTKLGAKVAHVGKNSGLDAEFGKGVHMENQFDVGVSIRLTDQWLTIEQR